MNLSTVRMIEELATNPLVAPYKRAFAAGILLMTFASLRFSDAQRLRTFEVNDDSVHGTLISCKTKKLHGQFWPWAFPRRGITGSRDWVQPIVEMRQAYRKINGTDPSFTFMRIDHAWELVAADAAPYSTARRKLALLCVGLGDTEGETYTLHSPKNMSPTAANQLNFDQRELNIIGHWSSNSKMPERYDRAACSHELLLRNTIVQRMNEGWGIAPAFHLPATVDKTVRIGHTNTAPVVPNQEDDPSGTNQATQDALGENLKPEGVPVLETAQLPTQVDTQETPGTQETPETQI